MDESLLNQENFCGPSGTWYGLNQSKKSDFRSKDPDFSNKMKGNGVSKTGQTGSDEMMKWGFNQPKLPQMVGVIPYRDPTWSLWCWYPAEVNPLILVALGLSEEYPSFHRLFGKVNLSFSETPKDHISFRDHFLYPDWLYPQKYSMINQLQIDTGKKTNRNQKPNVRKISDLPQQISRSQHLQAASLAYSTARSKSTVFLWHPPHQSTVNYIH